MVAMCIVCEGFLDLKLGFSKQTATQYGIEPM